MKMIDIITALKNNEIYKLRKYRKDLVFIHDYKRKIKGLNAWRIAQIHKKGFSVSDWKILGLDNKDYKKYLTTKEYYSIHPINGKYSDWIDDKLTLKYVLYGTCLSECMPHYYFLIDDKGQVKALMDCETQKDYYDADDVTDACMALGVLALKKIKGSLGIGFIKAEYSDSDGFTLNGVKLTRKEITDRIRSLRGYIVSEYLKPNKELARYCAETTNTIRYCVGRVDGKLVLLKSYIRFGTKKSGFVENFNSGGVLCYIDEEGCFQDGYVLTDLRNMTVERVMAHPDNGERLIGRIPQWNEMVHIVEKMDHLFPVLDYLGFDFVVTDKNQVKILEINSHSSLDTIQLDCPIAETKYGSTFFSKLLEEVAVRKD